ncbi:MAG TPA: J domain-containing protein, partial [Methyloceanibacter sp.]|nr:J domain-containing protein [Methyloceanibacter sp.]
QAGQGRVWSSPGADHEARLELSLEEAARGGEREVRLADATHGQSRAYRVKIPAGVRSGQRIRLSGRGGEGSGGGKTGDLYLNVDIAPHPRFRMDDGNLTVRVPVTPWEAALGSEIDVPTLDGPVRVRVPAGSSSGRKIRLKGKGFPGKDGPGDLFAELQVAVPHPLSDQERELFEKLKEASAFRPRD